MDQTSPDHKGTLSDKEFSLFRTLIYDRFGINLLEHKKALLVSRLQKILRNKNFPSYKAYYDYVISDSSGYALSELVNRISTNHTFFYREFEHFTLFSEKILPELKQKLLVKKSRDLRIWSAGCSSGEEPYMLIMLMKEFFGHEYANWNAGILATDISLDMLEYAKRGLFPEERFQNMPKQYIKKYFQKYGDDQYIINNEIKNEVTYRRLNLINPKFPFKSKFQVIFCRNVLIYFDIETKLNLVRRFHDILEPGGYLFIGHSESIGEAKKEFKVIAPAVFQK